MLSLRRLFGLILLFLFFEAAILVLGALLLPNLNVLWVCAVMTAIAVAIWLIYVLVTRWTMRPRTPQAEMTRNIPSPSLPPVPKSSADTETARLRELLVQAENSLAASPAYASWKERPRVAKLPVYLAVGNTGAGKTSALLNSGLDPHLLAGESHQDGVVVPTKLCNFYYAADSVIIEVSSQVFEDKDRWAHVLATLFRTEQSGLIRNWWIGRAVSRNLRGVILFSSLNIFSRSGEAHRASALSLKVQERLESLGKHVGADFAVYTIFTHCDTLPYFENYFAHLSEEEDREVLGCTLARAETGAVGAGDVHNESQRQRLSKYFNRLYSALANRRLSFLGRETVSARKPGIYEFPREFKRVRSEIVEFLVKTFRPSPLHPGPRLRGFYFSGIRKVATARPLATMADTAQIRRVSEATVLLKASDLKPDTATSAVMRPTSVQERTTARWAFLSKLFWDVILPDDAWYSPAKRDSRMERQRTLGFAALTIVCLLLTIAFVNSLVNNRLLLREAREATHISESSRIDPDNLDIDALRRLDVLREKLALLSRYKRTGPPIGFRWGLYAGNRVLPEMRRVYFAQFHRAFLAPMIRSLNESFNDLNPVSGTDSYDAVYDRLKSYRTVTSRACSPDASLLAKVLPETWLAGRSLDSERESLARRQIAYYISELAVHDPYDGSVHEFSESVKQAQSYLLSFKGPEQVYSGLIAAVNRSSQKSARLAQYAPNFGEVLTGPSEVPASFTRQGWDLVQARIRDKNFSALGEACVVGSGKASQALASNTLQTDVQNLYVRNYIKTWRDFLAGQSIAPYRGVDDAANKLGMLSSNRSPLLAVLVMVSDNMMLSKTQSPGSEQIGDKVRQSVQTGLRRFFPKAKEVEHEAKKAVPSEGGSRLSQSDILNVFQPVRTLVTPGNRDRLVGDTNRAYINSLAGLQTALEALPRERNARLDVSMNTGARQALDKAHAAVREAAQRFNINTAQGVDMDLTRFLEMPLEFAEPYVPRDPHKPLRDRVNGQMRAVCNKLSVLQRKFPFNPQADAEVTEQDLAAVFAPNVGALWSFQQLPPPVAGLLIKQGESWMQNPAVPEPRLTPEFIDFFNRMAAVSSALYPDATSKPSLQYTVQPLATEGAQAMRINIGGTVISSTGQPVQISWPPAPGSSFVDLQLIMNGLSIPFGRYEGQWAIFHLMQDGESQPPGSSVYIFRNLRQGHGKPQQVTNASGNSVSVRLMIQFPGRFDPRTFRARCPMVAAK